MIDIGKTEFLIDVPSLASDEFERYSSKLFDTWDEYIEKSLKLQDYSISLEVEEGSIKGTGRIAATLGVLYFGIGNYGSFISGLQTIRGQVSYLGDKLVASAVSPFGSENIRTTVRNNGGAISQLHKLFQKVQRGELTADQAMIEAERLFGDEASSSPEFMKTLHDGLISAPKHPEQITLLDQPDNIVVNESTENKKKKPTRPPTPKPNTPVNQYRVEIWRESKKDKKNLKITKL